MFYWTEVVESFQIPPAPSQTLGGFLHVSSYSRTQHSSGFAGQRVRGGVAKADRPSGTARTRARAGVRHALDARSYYFNLPGTESPLQKLKNGCEVGSSCYFLPKTTF